MTSIYQTPYMYNYGYGTNSNVGFRSNQPVAQTPVTQAPVAQAQSDVQKEDDPSLASSCLYGVGVFGGIRSIPHAIHPVNSWNALTETCSLFNEMGELKNLSKVEQADAFFNLFNASRLQPRGIADPQLAAKIKEAKEAYVSAIKAGDTVKMAKNGAKLTSLTSGSVPGIIFNKNPEVAKILSSAEKSGQAAAKLEASLKATTDAAKNANMVQKGCAGFKNMWKTGGGWFCVILESLAELPELLSAYSEGQSGDGIKQTAKSATKVAINTTGWIVGAAAGKTAGTLVGAFAAAKIAALAGTAVAPGVGTAIGAVCGFVGGLIGMTVGSWAAGKVSKAVTGKSFTEKKAEQEAKQQQLAMQMYQQQMQLNHNYATNPFYKQGMMIGY